MRRLAFVRAVLAAGLLPACSGTTNLQNTSLQLKAVGSIDASVLVNDTSANLSMSFVKPSADGCVIFSGMKAELDGQPAQVVNQGGWTPGGGGSMGCARPSTTVGWTDGGVHHLRVFDDSASFAVDFVVPLADSATLVSPSTLVYPSPDGGVVEMLVDAKPAEATPDIGRIVAGGKVSRDLTAKRGSDGLVHVTIDHGLGFDLDAGAYPAQMEVLYQAVITSCTFATCGISLEVDGPPSVFDMTLDWGAPDAG